MSMHSVAADTAACECGYSHEDYCGSDLCDHRVEIMDAGERRPLPNTPDPALIRYADFGEPGWWIMLVPIALGIIAIAAVIR